MVWACYLPSLDKKNKKECEQKKKRATDKKAEGPGGAIFIVNFSIFHWFFIGFLWIFIDFQLTFHCFSPLKLDKIVGVAAKESLHKEYVRALTYLLPGISTQNKRHNLPLIFV